MSDLTDTMHRLMALIKELNTNQLYMSERIRKLALRVCALEESIVPGQPNEKSQNDKQERKLTCLPGARIAETKEPLPRQPGRKAAKAPREVRQVFSGTKF